jgi:AcrR family transcriptional regulator
VTDTTGAVAEAADTATATDTSGSAVTVADQRRRILDQALDLMSQRGSTGTSMRQLAEACGLNVATLYHYFPSKADLLQAVIEHQHYGQRLAVEDPAIDPALPPGERLAAFLAWLWDETAAERPVMRLILGEGVRGDVTAQRAARNLVAALDTRLAQWMAQGFPELADRHVEPAVAGRVVRRHLLALVAESLATGQPSPGSAGVGLAAPDAPTAGDAARSARPAAADATDPLGATAARDLATALLG